MAFVPLINTIAERVDVSFVNYASIIREFSPYLSLYDYVRPFRILLASPFNHSLHDVIGIVTLEYHYDKLRIRIKPVIVRQNTAYPRKGLFTQPFNTFIFKNLNFYFFLEKKDLL